MSKKSGTRYIVKYTTMLNMDTWRVVWWCNDELHCFLDNTQRRVYVALGLLQENILQYTENAETYLKN